MSKRNSWVLFAILTLCNVLPLRAETLCPQASRWVQEHGVGLPKTYSDMLQVPLTYRHMIFDALSAEKKSELWVSHLEQYIQNHPELSGGQMDVLQQAIDLVSRPDFFSTQRSDAGWQKSIQKPIEQVERAAATQFTRDEVKAIFTQLGGDTVLTFPRAGQRADLPTKAVICTCSTQSDYCSGGSHCIAGNCSPQTGCGTFWRYACNGLCGF